MEIKPRRSVLYMPGANARALEKARSLPADSLILDLEDAVAPDSKEEARAQVCAAVDKGGYGTRELIIRVNGPDTIWGEADIAAANKAKPDAILVPKISTPQDIAAIDRLIAEGIDLWIMVETPMAIFNVEPIAAMAAQSKLQAMVMGTNDLIKDMQGQFTASRAPLQTALGLAVMAARAHGLAVIDGVYNDIANQEGFEAECSQGRDFGFDGKTLIHPSQLEAANQIFAPDIAVIEQARDIVKAFAAPENAGKGVLKVNGKMTELLHLEIARKTLAIADAISARAG